MQAILERADKREQLKQREAKKWDSELYILEKELKMQHHAIEHHGQTAAAGHVGADKSANVSNLQLTTGPANDQSLQMYAPADVYLGNGNFLARFWPTLMFGNCCYGYFSFACMQVLPCLNLCSSQTHEIHRQGAYVAVERQMPFARSGKLAVISHCARAGTDT